MKKKSYFERRRNIIIFAAIFISIVLYMAGVLSGLYANKILEQKTNEEISELKDETKIDIEVIREGTESQLEFMRNYIDFLDSNLKSMQLENLFMETLSPEEMCEFSNISMNYLISELGYYWDRLPLRLEEYESKNEISEEYNILKKQYTQLSLRTWLMARNQYKRCDEGLLNGLYFYSTPCEKCILQGEQLDKFSKLNEGDGIDSMIFTVDFNSDDLLIKFLKDYYQIEETPAIIINDEVYQGNVFEAEELKEDLR